MRDDIVNTIVEMYPERHSFFTPSAIGKRLDNIKQRYQRANDLEGQSAGLKGHYKQPRKRGIKKTRATAKKLTEALLSVTDLSDELRDQIPELPADFFYVLDANGEPDYSLLSQLNELLERANFCAGLLVDTLPGVSSAGMADDILIRRLARLQKELGGEPVARWGKSYPGDFIEFIKTALPYFGIHGIKAEAYLKRHYRAL